MDRKSFVLYTSSKDIVDDLDNEQTGILFKSILEFVTDGEPLEMDGMTKIVFKTIRSYLEKDFETYQTKCEVNRINGLKGGRPKGSVNKPKETEKTERLIQKPKKTLNMNMNYEFEFDSKEKGKKENATTRKTAHNVPTIDEVRQYIQSKGYAVDPQRFFDYYDANNWHDKDGKPVKSWKQKVITWSGRDTSQSKTRGTGVTISEEQRKEYSTFNELFGNE